MFTDEGETPLSEVLKSVKELENGEVAKVSGKATAEDLRKWFAQVLPNFDRERVYPSDIKKLISWYNLLIEAGITDFSVGKDAEEVETTEE